MSGVTEGPLSVRLGNVLFRVFVAGGVIFLVGPILTIMPLSFSAGNSLDYPLPGLSLQWFEIVFQPAPWMESLFNSLFVGGIVTILATSLGTLAAYGLTLSRFPGRSIVMALLVAPMIMPLVITGLAMYLTFAELGLLRTFAGLVLAHTVLAVPFVVITVLATLQGFDWNLVRAASSLGAEPGTAFRTVTLPLIAPGVMSGAVFAFVASFDEVVVANFIAGAGQVTVPMRMFAELRDKLDPSIVAVATFLTGVSILLLACVGLFRARSKRNK